MPARPTVGEDLGDARLHVRQRPGAVLEPESDVVLDTLHDELRGRVLEDEADALRHADRSQSADVLSVQFERAGHLGRDLARDQTGDRQRERALAGSGRSDDEQDRAGIDVEVDRVESRSIGAVVRDSEGFRAERDRCQSGNPSSTPACFIARWRATEPPATMTTAEIPMNTPRTIWISGSRSA